MAACIVPLHSAHIGPQRGQIDSPEYPIDSNHAVVPNDCHSHISLCSNKPLPWTFLLAMCAATSSTCCVFSLCFTISLRKDSVAVAPLRDSLAVLIINMGSQPIAHPHESVSCPVLVFTPRTCTYHGHR